MTTFALIVNETATELPADSRAVTSNRLRAVLDALDAGNVSRGTWARLTTGMSSEERTYGRRIVSTLQKARYRSEVEVAFREGALWARRPALELDDDNLETRYDTVRRVGASKSPADHVRDVVQHTAPPAHEPEGDPAGDGMQTEAEDLADFADKFRSIPGDMTDRTRGAAKLMGITPARAIRLRTLAAKNGLLAGVGVS